MERAGPRQTKKMVLVTFWGLSDWRNLCTYLVQKHSILSTPNRTGIVGNLAVSYLGGPNMISSEADAIITKMASRGWFYEYFLHTDDANWCTKCCYKKWMCVISIFHHLSDIPCHNSREGSFVGRTRSFPEKYQNADLKMLSTSFWERSLPFRENNRLKQVFENTWVHLTSCSARQKTSDWCFRRNWAGRRE